MKRKTEIELKRAILTKIVRTCIRLKHSVAADKEINEILADAEEAFDAAVAAGTLSGIDPKALAEKLLGETS